MYQEFNLVVEAGKGSPGWSLVALGIGARVAALGAGRRRGAQSRSWLTSACLSTRGCHLSAGLLVVGFVMAFAGAAAAADKPTGSPSSTVQQSQREQPTPSAPPSVELSFDTPKRFVVITEPGRNRQRLYGVGDSITDPADVGHRGKIQKVEPKRFKLSDSRTPRPVWVAQGDLVPGFSDWRFTKSAVLKGLDYQYIATAAPLDPEPRLLAIRADRATLQMDIPPPTSIATPPPREDAGIAGSRGPMIGLNERREETLLGRVRVKATGPHTYEVSGTDLQDALDHGGQLLAEVWPRVWPLLSVRDGVNLDVQSPLADGVIGPRGFRVTSPNLARRAGIEVGDVILEIDGQSVDSLGDLYRLYRKAVSEPLHSLVEVRLERQGTPISKLYRVR
jgi:hypothetical protein